MDLVAMGFEMPRRRQINKPKSRGWMGGGGGEKSDAV